MRDQRSVDTDPFYQAYDRRDQGTTLKKKHIRQFRIDFVEASGFRPNMSVLELGCGNGLFLRYLEWLGVADFAGVDGDSRIVQELPPALVGRVVVAGFDDYFDSRAGARDFDRIVLFDVLEHFSPEDGADLLRRVADRLTEDGRIVVRVPNIASPFGLDVQFNDVTHRAAYTPGSLRQVARAGGCEVVTIRSQANGTWIKDARERAFAACMRAVLVHRPAIWTPNMIGVLRRAT